jgi:hypothetical protein
VLAFSAADEEQGRKTFHRHWQIWVEEIDQMLRNCLFHEDIDVRTSEVQSKMIFMGHQISSCHVPVVRSFFIFWKMLLSSQNLPYDHLPKYTNIIFCYPKK